MLLPPLHLTLAVAGRTTGFPFQSGCCCCCLGIRGCTRERCSGAVLSQIPSWKQGNCIILQLHPNFWQRPMLQIITGIQGTAKLGPVTQGGFLFISQSAGLAVIARWLSKGRWMYLCLLSVTAKPCPEILIRPSFCLEYLGINFMVSFP